MKSQDVLLLIKLICLGQRERLQQKLHSEAAALIAYSHTHPSNYHQGWADGYAIRLGNAREANLANEILHDRVLHG